MIEAPPKKRMRKPAVCDACKLAAWPGFGVGCPCFASERPPELVGVYLWHCGAPGCEADCIARYAAKLRSLGRFDLAAKMTGERLAAPEIRHPVNQKPAARAAGQPSLFGD